jgi:antagonist of KipI
VSEKTRSISSSLIPRYSRFPTVRFIRGVDFELLADRSQATLKQQDFVVTKNSNRMGFRLQGEPLIQKDPQEMVSSAVTFGTVQLLPDGQLIVLMADQQTSGGYPRIAHVIERDLPLLAQLGPNDKVAFHEVELPHAEELIAEFERDLALLRVGVHLSGSVGKL